MSGVVGNSYQFGKSSTPPLIAAFSKGLPFTIVWPAGLYDARAPIAGLLVKADSPLKKASDLNGKTIAVGALNDIHSLAVMAWMDKNGGDSTTVKFTEVPISEIPIAIAQGRVVAGSVNEPVLSAALDDKTLRSLGAHFSGIAPALHVHGLVHHQNVRRSEPGDREEDRADARQSGRLRQRPSRADDRSDRKVHLARAGAGRKDDARRAGRGARCEGSCSR